MCPHFPKDDLFDSVELTRCVRLTKHISCVPKKSYFLGQKVVFFWDTPRTSLNLFSVDPFTDRTHDNKETKKDLWQWRSFYYSYQKSIHSCVVFRFSPRLRTGNKRHNPGSPAKKTWSTNKKMLLFLLLLIRCFLIGLFFARKNIPKWNQKF